MTMIEADTMSGIYTFTHTSGDKSFEISATFVANTVNEVMFNMEPFLIAAGFSVKSVKEFFETA